MSERSAFVIIILSVGLFSFKTSQASSYPTHSAAVQIIATVETPLGYKTIETSGGTANADQLLVQYPAISGVQLLIVVDGTQVDQISLDQPNGLPSNPAFQLVRSDLLSRSAHIEERSCVVTFISIAQ